MQPADEEPTERIPAPERATGERVGPYRIDAELGAGGMGTVYRAVHEQLGRTVALKLLPPALAAEPELVARFAREARALARLRHPGIVTVYDSGSDGGRHWLAMEYVEGRTLRALLVDGRPAPAEALRIVGAALVALQHAHEQGIIHRDLKPENILLDAEGRPRIADFGLARIVDSAGSTRLTHPSVLMGTPDYMAPEQRECTAEADHRADLYAMGVVLHELLTGELPLGRWEPPSRCAGTSPALDEVVGRALSADPAARHASAREMAQALERAMLRPRRRWRLAAALALLAFVLTAFFTCWSGRPREIEPARLHQALLWQIGSPQLDGPPRHVVAADGRIYLATDRRLYAVDPRDGKPRRLVDLPLDQPPTAAGRKLVCVSGRRLLLVDPPAPIREMPLEGHGALFAQEAGGVLYAAQESGHLLAVSIADGALLWRHRIPLPVTSAPAVYSRSIQFFTDDGRDHACDRQAPGSSSTGSGPARIGGRAVRYSGGPVRSGEQWARLAASEGGKAWVVLHDASGSVSGTVMLGPGLELAGHAPTWLPPRRLVVTTRSGLICADLDRRAVVWRVDGGELRSRALAVPGRGVLAPIRGGILLVDEQGRAARIQLKVGVERRLAVLVAGERRLLLSLQSGVLSAYDLDRVWDTQ